MLTPEYLNLIEFNDVVELYNQLSIDITADIINRVSQFQDITTTTKEQLKILKQANGEQIFNEALEKTAMLTADTKKALKQLYVEVAQEDMQGYEELYQYNDKTFALSSSQMAIVNAGLKQTNRTLKNFTNTIAFQSQQAYVNAIDNAYMKVASGAFSYSTAIATAVQELAEQGITLKDSLGRNVQLEVAVRRNVLSGIRDTANKLERDIEKDLGCDGYEVTAHLGARPTHAEAQGKQYAITADKAKEFGVQQWKEVADLWEEYNCRHTYFGIILGISEPQYTDKELDEMKNATVNIDGKEVPYYEATQKQRRYENAIRKQKKTVQTLEKAGQDATIQKTKLRKLNKQYNNFLKETGLSKDYSRLKVANVDRGGIIKQSDIVKQLQSLNIEYNPVKKLKKQLSSEEIIQKIAGGDKTKGSCSSLAFAYIGNRNGLDVLDFRGGASQDYFATIQNVYQISQLSGVKSIVEENTNDITATLSLLKKAEIGKEYYLSTGEHAAIIKGNEKGFLYLNLQDPNPENNGFRKLTMNTLKGRFGCKQTHSKYGCILKPKHILIDADTLKDNKEFEEILGYINTAKNKQMKGENGGVK